MFTQVTSDTYQDVIAATAQGVLICTKKLCPHCKNMKKVMEKFSAQRAGLSFLELDSEDEPDVMTALGAERVPTVLIIKEGKVVAKKAALMNPREMLALYDGAK